MATVATAAPAAASDAVVVAVRCRPALGAEGGAALAVAVGSDARTITLRDGVSASSTRSFTFDYVQQAREAAVAEDQAAVYTRLGAPLIEAVRSGFNCSVFAYGQTGSGKSFTMVASGAGAMAAIGGGSATGSGLAEHSGLGFIPRFCDALFRTVRSGEAGASVQVEASYAQIYNERVSDLLAAESLHASTPAPFEVGRGRSGAGAGAGAGDLAMGSRLRVREDAATGPFVEGLTWHPVGDYGMVERLLRDGQMSRAVAATSMNATSSRSHAVFTLRWKCTRMAGPMVTDLTSKIVLVDLAGSERASKTGAEGARLREAGAINKSLSALGRVIQALAKRSEGSDAGDVGASPRGGGGEFIPYRESVLTRLLQDTLGGNSKTVMIATISPSVLHYDETLSTLRYAERAKQIRNRAVVNEDPNMALIRQLREELALVQAQLAEARQALAAVARGEGLPSDNAALLSRLEALNGERHAQDAMLQQLRADWEARLAASERERAEFQTQLQGLGMRIGTGGGDEAALGDPTAPLAAAGRAITAFALAPPPAGSGGGLLGGGGVVVEEEDGDWGGQLDEDGPVEGAASGSAAAVPPLAAFTGLAATPRSPEAAGVATSPAMPMPRTRTASALAAAQLSPYFVLRLGDRLLDGHVVYALRHGDNGVGTADDNVLRFQSAGVQPHHFLVRWVATPSESLVDVACEPAAGHAVFVNGVAVMPSSHARSTASSVVSGSGSHMPRPSPAASVASSTAAGDNGWAETPVAGAASSTAGSSVTTATLDDRHTVRVPLQTGDRIVFGALPVALTFVDPRFWDGRPASDDAAVDAAAAAGGALSPRPPRRSHEEALAGVMMPFEEMVREWMGGGGEALISLDGSIGEGEEDGDGGGGGADGGSAGTGDDVGVRRGRILVVDEDEEDVGDAIMGGGGQLDEASDGSSYAGQLEEGEGGDADGRAGDGSAVVAAATTTPTRPHDAGTVAMAGSPSSVALTLHLTTINASSRSPTSARDATPLATDFNAPLAAAATALQALLRAHIVRSQQAAITRWSDTRLVTDVAAALLRCAALSGEINALLTSLGSAVRLSRRAVWLPPARPASDGDSDWEALAAAGDVSRACMGVTAWVMQPDAVDGSEAAGAVSDPVGFVTEPALQPLAAALRRVHATVAAAGSLSGASSADWSGDVMVAVCGAITVPIAYIWPAGHRGIVSAAARGGVGALTDAAGYRSATASAALGLPSPGSPSGLRWAPGSASRGITSPSLRTGSAGGFASPMTPPPGMSGGFAGVSTGGGDASAAALAAAAAAAAIARLQLEQVVATAFVALSPAAAAAVAPTSATDSGATASELVALSVPLLTLWGRPCGTVTLRCHVSQQAAQPAADGGGVMQRQLLVLQLLGLEASLACRSAPRTQLAVELAAVAPTADGAAIASEQRFTLPIPASGAMHRSSGGLRIAVADCASVGGGTTRLLLPLSEMASATAAVSTGATPRRDGAASTSSGGTGSARELLALVAGWGVRLAVRITRGVAKGSTSAARLMPTPAPIGAMTTVPCLTVHPPRGPAELLSATAVVAEPAAVSALALVVLADVLRWDAAAQRPTPLPWRRLPREDKAGAGSGAASPAVLASARTAAPAGATHVAVTMEPVFTVEVAAAGGGSVSRADRTAAGGADAGTAGAAPPQMALFFSVMQLPRGGAGGDSVARAVPSPLALEACSFAAITDVRLLPIAAHADPTVSQVLLTTRNAGGDGVLSQLVQHRDAAAGCLRIVAPVPPTSPGVPGGGILAHLSHLLAQPTPRGFRIYVRVQVSVMVRGLATPVAFARWLAFEAAAPSMLTVAGGVGTAAISAPRWALSLASWRALYTPTGAVSARAELDTESLWLRQEALSRRCDVLVRREWPASAEESADKAAARMLAIGQHAVVALFRHATPFAEPLAVPPPTALAEGVWDMLLPPPEDTVKLPRCDMVLVAKGRAERSGYLNKRGATFGRWARRWWSLTAPWLTSWHSASEADSSAAPSLVLPVTVLQAAAVPGAAGACELELRHVPHAATGITAAAPATAAATKTWRLQASSETERDAWVADINAAAAACAALGPW